jgi:hypothetical protein
LKSFRAFFFCEKSRNEIRVEKKGFFFETQRGRLPCLRAALACGGPAPQARASGVAPSSAGSPSAPAGGLQAGAPAPACRRWLLALEVWGLVNAPPCAKGAAVGAGKIRVEGLILLRRVFPAYGGALAFFIKQKEKKASP